MAMACPKKQEQRGAGARRPPGILYFGESCRILHFFKLHFKKNYCTLKKLHFIRRAVAHWRPRSCTDRPYFRYVFIFFVFSEEWFLRSVEPLDARATFGSPKSELTFILMPTSTIDYSMTTRSNLFGRSAIFIYGRHYTTYWPSFLVRWSAWWFIC